MNILVALLYLGYKPGSEWCHDYENASITESVIMSDGGFDVEVPITLLK